MKQNYKEENPGCLKLALIFLIFLAVSILFFSCAVSKQPQYKVTSVSKIKGHNAYIVTTDSFKVVRVIRGGFKYRPKTISKQGYKF